MQVGRSYLLNSAVREGVGSAFQKHCEKREGDSNQIRSRFSSLSSVGYSVEMLLLCREEQKASSSASVQVDCFLFQSVLFFFFVQNAD